MKPGVPPTPTLAQLERYEVAADRVYRVLRELRWVGNRPANRGKYVEHDIDDAHSLDTSDDCRICSALTEYEKATGR